MKIEKQMDSSGKISKNGDSFQGPADFETAIEATGFGRFNLILALLALPCGWAAMFDSTTMSYVLPAAHCDLGLGLDQKGLLNGVTYLGMVTSAFVWGFLADAYGRKRLLVAGYGLDAFFVLLAGFSQSFAWLMAAKFMTGFIINGPFAALTAALSEFHSKKYRSKLLLNIGIIYGLGNMGLPLIAWAVLPQYWEVSTPSLKLHSWNFFLLICALPSCASAVGHSFLPESPKFLMTSGRNEEALKVLRTIYSMNTGRDPETFPVKSLVDEIEQSSVHKRGFKEKFGDGVRQIKSLFLPPHLVNIVLVCAMVMGLMTGSNTLRLWLPQIFTAINDYEALNNKTTNLCQMLDIITPKNDSDSIAECFVNKSVTGVYTNVLIVAAASIISSILAGLFINKVGKKVLLVVLGSIGGVAGFCIYFAQNVETTTTLSAMVIALVGVCVNVELAIIVDLFPTALRAFAISLALMIGRVGAMIGNVAFPILLTTGCLPPFLLIGCCLLISVMITILLPNTDMKSLE